VRITVDPRVRDGACGRLGERGLATAVRGDGRIQCGARAGDVFGLGAQLGDVAPEGGQVDIGERHLREVRREELDHGPDVLWDRVDLGGSADERERR
jgi:hypothetical protein